MATKIQQNAPTCNPVPSPEEIAAAVATFARLLAALSAPAPTTSEPAYFFTTDKAIREKTGWPARTLNEAACAKALDATKVGRGWRFTPAALAAWEAARSDGRGRRTRTPKPTPANDAPDVEASLGRLAAVGGVARRGGR